MSGGKRAFDDVRAVTVTDNVASITLVAFVLLVGGGLGLGLAFSGGGDSGGAPSANFSFEYVDQANTMFVTMKSGDEIPASELVVVSGETSKTWATLADTNNSSMVAPGNSIALGKTTPFGKAITSDDRVIIRWVGNNQTKRLGNWSGSSKSLAPPG